MKVAFKSITPEAEVNIVEIARVSSSRKDKKAKPEGLINYLIKHKHWSPFEHSYLTVEIETSKAIGIQLIRHRSFTFQEFSQRYQDVGAFEEMFEEVELRKQAENNRQSSTELFDSRGIETYDIYGAPCGLNSAIEECLAWSRTLYQQMLRYGVARECARMILPLATKTRIYMTGSIRSWIHFLEIRDDEHAQKEIQEIAKAIKEIFVQQLPLISKALNY
jgi:thymidylate synthase (FAD)